MIREILELKKGVGEHILNRGHELGLDAQTAIANARRVADTIDRGMLA